MKDIKAEVNECLHSACAALYPDIDITLEAEETKSGFEGAYSAVVFPLVKHLKRKPEEIAEDLGKEITKNETLFSGYNVVKGFLNLQLKDSYLAGKLTEEYSIPATGKTVMVEYSSPNTNKPLHLGHIRNNLLGHSVAEILKAAGNELIKTQIINDRGIHICKSMWAWNEFAEGETPESAGMKGDKLVGKYYVKFDAENKKAIKELTDSGTDPAEAAKQSAPLLKAQEMLRDWENNAPEVRKLWEMMNQWVYDGFEKTYRRLGVHFDKIQYESNTYLLGKDIVQKGLEKGIFFKKEDGSVWIDLTDEGLDEKLLLRGDGTAVYITQDLGTAIQRFEENPISSLIYTVGNEQDYHFKVLFTILKKLGYEWADSLYHLSYGMVELPDGKMKSREGTVVDADDLMEEMYSTAKQITEEMGKLESLTAEEKEETYEKIGMAALKYYILKVDPQKKMLFDPKKSIDFQGNTGPFILYTYARIQSLLKKADKKPENDFAEVSLSAEEQKLILLIDSANAVILKAAETLSPALIANYTYELVKQFNSFYQSHPVLNCEEEKVQNVRLTIASRTAETIKKMMHLLGIQTVNRM